MEKHQYVLVYNFLSYLFTLISRTTIAKVQSINVLNIEVIVFTLYGQCTSSMPAPKLTMTVGLPLAYQWVNSLKNKYSALY